MNFGAQENTEDKIFWHYDINIQKKTASFSFLSAKGPFVIHVYRTRNTMPPKILSYQIQQQSNLIGLD